MSLSLSSCWNSEFSLKVTVTASEIIISVISTQKLNSTWGLLRLSTARSSGWWGLSAGHPRPASATYHISSGTSPVFSICTGTLVLFTLSQAVWINIISFEVKKQPRSWERRNGFVVWLKDTRDDISKFKMPVTHYQKWKEVVTSKTFLLPLLNPVSKANNDF